MGQGKCRPQLRVGSFQKRKRRTSEASFETSFDAALFECGIISWHMACREKGWPDRYLSAGRWVELKSLEHLGTRHELSKEQIIKLNELTRAGEACYYCAKWQDSFILLPWTEFKQHKLIPANCPRYYYRTKADIKEAIKWIILSGSSTTTKSKTNCLQFH